MEAASIFAEEADKERFNCNEQVVQLWSYQQALRLRHLSQIVGRNLKGHGSQVEPTPASPLPSKSPRPPTTVGYFFTLHSPTTKENLYSSELQCTCNPNWLEMHPENINPINVRSLKCILIRLWFKSKGGVPELITSWGVHFSGLIPIGSVMPYTSENYEPNTLILKLRNAFYTAPGCCSYSSQKEQHPLHFGYSLPLSETKRSYTVNSLSRLHSTKRAQRQQEIRCQETYSVLEYHGVTRNSKSSQLSTKVEDFRVKVALLREQLEIEIDQLRALKLSAENLENQNQEKGIELLGGYQDLHRQRKYIRSLQEASHNESEKLRYSCSCLRNWRIQLFSQLPLIYPINQDSNGKFHVCGVHLPDAEQYENISDVTLSVGLGYVAHILYILAQFLNVPLRYPINPYGSQATITDTTSLQLRDSEREFPLFSRGKEKEKLHFNYGVFLLNKNIAQMRWYGGILTQNLRPTLPNLNFFISRLIQASSGGSQPVAVMPDALVPPLISRDYVGYEVRTPASLLEQKRTHQQALDPVHHVNTSEINRLEIEEHEDVVWKALKSSSDTDSPSEASPSKLSLFVREVTPLEGTESSGKFVFVDQVHSNIDSTLTEKSIEERLSHSNGFSFSLDNGLNHIGGKSSALIGLSSCDDLNINKVSKMLKNLPRGSDPSLLTKVDIEEEENLPVFKEQTTELLRSWTEDAPSHYLGIAEVSSSERLEEVGVECHESFMCPIENKSVSCTIDSKPPEALSTKINMEESEKGKAGELANSSDSELSKATKGVSSAKEDELSKALESVSSAKEGEDSTEATKSENGVESTTLSLSDFGVTEDMFLNDVAFRTAALASQNFSFKMSFSRQSTEDEYH
ncbi:UV radiation resistance-associated gene protein [Palaemon carinicauda]|uniref:UV radiation resistance-associated gene protein n=1 Tax=Palaemon carinicauda TaxID=392227 RepID=UPI0035B5E020